MNHFTLTFVLLLSFQALFSQTSMPNFTVQDSKGNYHTLYNDYLDQEKTVLIKFFYSSCPPCNSIAPSLQALYETWGGGEYDVEFIELSIQAWETDETVNSYLDNHDITFPSVSAEGGSLEAIEAIENEGYGPVYSTPTFAVVAPDGSTGWDVRRFDNAQTIEAIDNALGNTGAMKPISSTGIPQQERFLMKILSNPVDKILSMDFHLPESGKMYLAIFNILGSKLEHVDAGYFEKGFHHVQHLLTSYRGGTYIVRAEFNEIHTKSLRFVKN